MRIFWTHLVRHSESAMVRVKAYLFVHGNSGGEILPVFFREETVELTTSLCKKFMIASFLLRLIDKVAQNIHICLGHLAFEPRCPCCHLKLSWGDMSLDVSRLVWRWWVKRFLTVKAADVGNLHSVSMMIEYIPGASPAASNLEDN